MSRNLLTQLRTQSVGEPKSSSGSPLSRVVAAPGRGPVRPATLRNSTTRDRYDGSERHAGRARRFNLGVLQKSPWHMLDQRSFGGYSRRADGFQNQHGPAQLAPLHSVLALPERRPDCSATRSPTVVLFPGSVQQAGKPCQRNAQRASVWAPRFSAIDTHSLLPQERGRSMRWLLGTPRDAAFGPHVVQFHVRLIVGG